MSVRFNTTLALCASAILVTACGGGSGSDASSSAAPTNNTGGGTGSGTATPQVQAPTIVSSPLSVQAEEGSAARFSVRTDGASDTFQWEVSAANGAWAALVGETGAELIVQGVTLHQSGNQYRAVASRSGLSTASAAATLQVNERLIAPAIAVQPLSLEAVEGATLRFSVSATGTRVAYQWQARSPSGDWANIDGAQGDELILTGFEVRFSGYQVRVQITNAAGSVYSDAATMRIKSTAPILGFSQQPAALTVTAPAIAAFAVVAFGDPAPVVYWERSPSATAPFERVANAAGGRLELTVNDTALNGYRFRAVATSSSGTITSDVATLTVLAADSAATVARQPQNLSVQAGQTAIFSALAAGSPQPSYQWQVSRDSGATFTDIAGAIDPVLQFQAQVSDNGALYRVGVYNGVGGRDAKLPVYSNAAALTITATDLYAVLTAPRVALTGTTVVVSGSAAGSAATDPIGYRWQLVSRPATSDTSLSDTNVRSPSLPISANGPYALSLEVNASGRWSAPSSAQITAFTPAQALTVATARSCMACHAVDKKIIGPSFADVAKRHAGRAQLVEYLMGKIKNGGSGVWGPVPMPATREITGDETELLARWIMSMN